jgi:hypothetical protein
MEQNIPWIQAGFLDKPTRLAMHSNEILNTAETVLQGYLLSQ